MAKKNQATFEFMFDEQWYTTQGAETMIRTATKDDMRTIRSEYTRMRDVAQKRTKRLGKEFSESKAYKTHSEGFPKLKEIDPRDFAKAFHDLAKFVQAKGSTVSGQREIQEKTIATLNKAIGAYDYDDDEEEDSGQTPVTKQNYWKVIKILEEARRQKLFYGSDKVVSLAETMVQMNDRSDDWIDHLETLLTHADELQEIPDVRGYSFNEIVKKLGN